MKLSKIISAAAVVVAFSAITCVSAYAATEIKTGNYKYTYDDEEETAERTLTIQVKSSDYEKLATAKFTVGYDTDKYTLETISSKVGTCVANQGVDGIKGCLVSFASPNGVTMQEGKYTTLATLYFSEGPEESATNSTDFSILNLDSLSYFEGVKAIDIEKTAVGTFVLYKFPVEVDESWTKGYIQGLDAVVKDGDNVLATVPIKNYYIEDGNYVFVLKLVPSTSNKKMTVDVDIQASLSTAEDTPEGEWTKEVIDTISGVIVENLQ